MAPGGAVAVAHPVSGIKIDGDLSDWPAGNRSRFPAGFARSLPQTFHPPPRNLNRYTGIG